MLIRTLVPIRMEHARYEIVQRVSCTDIMQARSCAIASIVPQQTSTNAVLRRAIATLSLVHGAMCTEWIKHH
jgi:hypothetical protein